MMTEMDQKRKIRTWVLVAIIAMVLLGAIATGWWFMDLRLERARAEQAAPTILVREPLQGQTYKTNDSIAVKGTAIGPYPIVQVELYLDGELLDVDESVLETGADPFFASFRFRIPAGVHMIYLRCLDTNGSEGQSLSVSVEASDEPSGSIQAFILYDQESSLADIAEGYDVPLDLLVSSNPGLEDPDLPPPDLLTIPSGMDPEEEEDDDTTDILPSDFPGSSAGPGDFQAGTSLTATGALFPDQNVTGLPWTFITPDSKPGAPTNVRAQVEDCLVSLAWNSTSDAEQFWIWLDKQNGTRVLVAKLKPTEPSSARYQFKFEPRISGNIGLVVEAVNALGSQSSSPASVVMASSCQPEPGSRIEFEALNVKGNQDFSQVYFYISFEGQPEQRFPLDDSHFYGLVGGVGQIQPHASADQVLVLPSVGEGALDISGECWGLAGGKPVLLERFSETVRQMEAGSQEVILGGASCQLTAQLSVVDESQALTAYDGDMGGLPAPYNLRDNVHKELKPYLILGSYVPAHEWLYRFTRIVTWSWDGNPADITGFTIYVNGKPEVQVQGADTRKAMIIVPDKCGFVTTWGVVANGKGGDSPMSQVAGIYMSPCTRFLKVEFRRLYFSRTCDGRGLYCGIQDGLYCDELEAYFELSVNQVTRKFYSGNFVLKVTCHDLFFFKDIVTTPNGQVFLVPLFTELDTVDSFDVVVETEFWDEDTWSGDDSFGHHKKKHGFAQWPQAISWLQEYCEGWVCDIDPYVWIDSSNIDADANTDINYIITFYPNNKQSSPP